MFLPKHGLYVADRGYKLLFSPLQVTACGGVSGLGYMLQLLVRCRGITGTNGWTVAVFLENQQHGKR